MKKLFVSPLTQVMPTANGNPLLWRPDLGFGYLKSNGLDYEGDYWAKYQRYKLTTMGVALNNFRISFVRQFLPKGTMICDVGIGSGHFVETFPCMGYDVNTCAVKWLMEKAYYADPYQEPFDALSFWDVIEHIDDPSALLKASHIFISIPIHQSMQACLASKHLRPDEHIWHFTEGGLKNFMACYGYQLIAKSDGETQIGREDIMSYYFHK